MLTFEKVMEIFKDYLEADRDLELILTSRGYLRILWSHNGFDYEDGALCRTPDELFDVLLADCESFHHVQATHGMRELTQEDREQAKAKCRVYIEKRQAIEH